MHNYYWTTDSWGDAYPPENADEIVSAANDMIDAYALRHTDEDVACYSDSLWEIYCCTGCVSPEAQKIIDAGLYDAAVELMDDEIREPIHAAIAPCSEIAFLGAYMIAHREKHGEEFSVN